MWIIFPGAQLLCYLFYVTFRGEGQSILLRPYIKNTFSGGGGSLNVSFESLLKIAHSCNSASAQAPLAFLSIHSGTKSETWLLGVKYDRQHLILDILSSFPNQNENQK